MENKTDVSWVGGARKKRVLFICTHNASRSQMAEGWLRALKGDRYEVYSAGTEPTGVHPAAITAMAEAGIDIRWQGAGVDEQGVDAATGRVLVKVDPRYYRPTEVELLLGDPSKAKAKLGWQAEVSLKELVTMMVREDMQQAKRDILCSRNGFEIHAAHE